MHYTTMKICQETEEKYNLPVSQQVVAAIAETVWRQTESFAVDLELFARSASACVCFFVLMRFAIDLVFSIKDQSTFIFPHTCAFE